ncbi:MAG: hypothetical protein LWX56_04935 [Ignavibacteria bacterium]|nr:hypothetical protein [Ignavibacteria bacterium]
MPDIEYLYISLSLALIVLGAIFLLFGVISDKRNQKRLQLQIAQHRAQQETMELYLRRQQFALQQIQKVQTEPYFSARQTSERPRFTTVNDFYY